MTTLDAQQYWENYYARPFTFGMGTEEILALLGKLPQVRTWTDLGCGSESLLWACAIRAESLTAVDLDPERLALLKANAHTPSAQGAYATAMQLGGRPPDEWPAVCGMLKEVREADCLHETPTELGQADLVSQFGLLGLCVNETHFTNRVRSMCRLATPGGWLAGANWMSAIHPGRLALDEQLYRNAFDKAGAVLTELRRIPSSDPDYPQIWAYLAQVPAPRG